MTIAELQRVIDSKLRVMKLQAQERAINDYTLADLIGRSIARIYSSTATYPDIAEVYPNLFDAEELEQKKQEQKTELSILRFKQFANTYNEQFKGVQSEE